MNIFLANESRQGIGGGWTFMQNLREGFQLIKADIQFTDDITDADIYFIPGATMVTRESVLWAKENGKKIILRIDNIPRNSRNRNTGTTRLYDFGQLADIVIYQSEWSRKKIEPLLDSERDDISNSNNGIMYGTGGKKLYTKDKGSVIINGVNTHIFSPDGDKIEKTSNIQHRYLIVRYNRDNNKRIEEAFDIYTKEWIQNKDIELWVVGNFSREMVVSHFDFYLGERYQMYGVVENRKKLAGLMRSCDTLIYPSYSDACPNTVLEARSCGCRIMHNGHAGIPEVMDEDLDISLERMAKEYYELMK